MSAICGLVNLNGQFIEAQNIDRLMTALEVYGPDGAEVWREETAALGHQMLHITPESLQEKLPWQDEVTELVITADARIDNRKELFNALGISSGVSQTITDSQLILKAYIKWGEQCPQRLLGDFAFAIWDARNQKLFCARDILGTRPFYYYSSDASFVFASDLNGLLATPQVPRRYNEAFLGAFLQQEDTLFAQKRLTFYERVYKLPPAHYLTLTPTKQEIKSYWSPENAPQIELASEAEYREKLRELLNRAVKCRLRSAFPIGAHLSGGLDSSAIAVVASRALQENGETLTGFSWSPPLTKLQECTNDERKLVDDVCNGESIDCHNVSLRRQDFINSKTRDFTTEPAEMLYFEQLVQTEAARQDIRVLLAGWGGDEAITFNGRGYFAELFQQGRWSTLYRELTLRSELHGLNLRGPVLEKVILPLLPDSIYPTINNIINKRNQPIGDKSFYIQPQFAQRIQSEIEQLPRLPMLLRERAGVRSNQLMLLAYGHLTRRIESWAISGAKNKLVYSYPLLDRRILEFALGIPVDLFFKYGWKRYLFRSATASILPEQVRWHKTKREPALLEIFATCQDQPTQNTLNDIFQASFQANCQSAYLNELVNIQKVEQGLKDIKHRQPGFWQAVMLVSNLSRIENN